MNEHDDDSRAPEVPHSALVMGYQRESQSKDLESRIKNAMRIMAGIINDEGEEYLPIFERLEKELFNLQRREEVLHRVKSFLED